MSNLRDANGDLAMCKRATPSGSVCDNQGYLKGADREFLHIGREALPWWIERATTLEAALALMDAMCRALVNPQGQLTPKIGQIGLTYKQMAGELLALSATARLAINGEVSKEELMNRLCELIGANPVVMATAEAAPRASGKLPLVFGGVVRMNHADDCASFEVSLDAKVIHARMTSSECRVMAGMLIALANQIDNAPAEKK